MVVRIFAYQKIFQNTVYFLIIFASSLLVCSTAPHAVGHKDYPHCLIHWEPHKLISHLSEFQAYVLENVASFVGWLVFVRSDAVNPSFVSCTLSVLCCRMALSPAMFTRVCSSMLAAELAGLLGCRCCCPSPLLTYAERLRTDICLAVALSLISSACRFDILLSFCTGEKKTVKWWRECMSGVIVLYSCVNLRPALTKKNESSG